MCTGAKKESITQIPRVDAYRLPLYALAEERVREILNQVWHAGLIQQVGREAKRIERLRREVRASCRCTATPACSCCVPGQSICAA
jgi:hypothetical protein